MHAPDVIKLVHKVIADAGLLTTVIVEAGLTAVEFVREIALRQLDQASFQRQLVVETGVRVFAELTE